MPRSRRNAVADMVDLGIRLVPHADQPEQGPETFSLQTSLRVGYADHECTEHGIAFRTAVKRLTIRVVMEGLEMAPGLRPHDPTKDRSEVVKVSKRSEIKTEKNVTAGLKLGFDLDKKPEVSLAMGADGKKSWTDSETVEKSNEISSRCVVARPGDRWEIKDPDNEVLEATYLTENDPLGNVVVKDRSNRRAVSATVEILQKDLHVEITDVSGIRKIIPKKIQPNKDRLAAIVLAKNLSAQLGEAYTGKIVLSHAEDEHD